jgi:hypothetical protein
MSSPRSKGSRRSSTVSTTLKMAVLAPIPSAKVVITTALKAGVVRRLRSP